MPERDPHEMALAWQLLHAEATFDRRLTHLRRHDGAWRRSRREALAAIRRDLLGPAGRAAPGLRELLRRDPPARPPHVVLATDPGMPASLVEVEPPVLGLWTRGDQPLLAQGVRVAMVGSRQPRGESLAAARRIAGDLAAAGVTIVSGLARGIDGVAHRAALDRGGSTIAVLGGGLDRIHPARHVPLARELATGSASGGPRGLLVSEYGDGAQLPRTWRFRERNRVIAALSDYVVVVQAGQRSGSMGTARAALALGIEVAAVPGAMGDSAFEGSLELIRDGACCVLDAAGVARALGRPELARGEVWAHPLASILSVPRTVDEVAWLAGMELGDARRMLLDLECEGHLQRTPDARVVAV